MKNCKKVILLLLLAFFSVLALFYRRSLPLEKIFPTLDLSQCTRITLQGEFYKKSPRESIAYHRAFGPGEEEFDQLLSLLKQANFRRSLWGLLPGKGTRSHPIQTGDLQWEIHCLFPDSSLRVQNFFGDFTLNFKETSSLPVLPASSQWADAVTDFLTK